MLTISRLFIYPVKSLGGISLSESIVTSRGLQYDRRYMLVDANNVFITQREHPELALYRTAIEGDQLWIYHKNNTENRLVLPLTPVPSAELIPVKIWEDHCQAQVMDTAADEWFVRQLGFSCRLVYMPDTTGRKVDSAYAFNGEITSFADGFPLLVIGQASLDALNLLLADPVAFDRFRPNLVFCGGTPFEEDSMKNFSINGIGFEGVKLSARCVITTTNQETGLAGKEPLKTLSGFRMKNKKVLFGQNVLVKGEGKIRLGQQIEMIRQPGSPG